MEDKNARENINAKNKELDIKLKELDERVNKRLSEERIAIVNKN